MVRPMALQLMPQYSAQSSGVVMLNIVLIVFMLSIVISVVEP